MFALPVSIIQFNAYQQLGNIEIDWKVTETDTYKYEIERSADGRTFYKIGEVLATGAAGIQSYTFLDTNPIQGVNFYRLRILDIQPLVKYTSILKVSLNVTASLISIYPNPTPERLINIEMKKMAKGTYEFILYNSMGQELYKHSFIHQGNASSEVIQLPATLSRGVYYAAIQGTQRVTTKVLVLE